MSRIFNYYSKIPNNLLKNYLPKSLFNKDTKIPLGRWGNIINQNSEDSSIINKKIDRISNLANYDHCGPCGNSYSITKIKYKKKYELSDKYQHTNPCDYYQK